MGLRTVTFEARTWMSCAAFAMGIAVSLTARQDPARLVWEAVPCTVNHCWGCTIPSLQVEKTTMGCRWHRETSSEADWQRPKRRPWGNYSGRENASVKQVAASAIPTARTYHAQGPQKPLPPIPHCSVLELLDWSTRLLGFHEHHFFRGSWVRWLRY